MQTAGGGEGRQPSPVGQYPMFQTILKVGKAGKAGKAGTAGKAGKAGKEGREGREGLIMHTWNQL